jgi:hypothetical protein
MALKPSAVSRMRWRAGVTYLFHDALGTQLRPLLNIQA